MKITDIRTFVMGVPGRNWVFVKILTDEGLYGWGEATMEWHEKAVLGGIETVKPLLLGADPLQIEHIWQILFRHHWWRESVSMKSAISGIDHALWDIAGKAYGQPVYRLLGGAIRRQVELYARGDLGLANDVREAEAAWKEGFTAFKGGVSLAPRFDEKAQVDRMIAECAEIERSVGHDLRIMLDLQGVFSVKQIVRLVDGLRDRNIFWIEEPVPMQTWEPMRQLMGSRAPFDFALGERLCSRWEFRPVIEQHLADIVQPDICHAGGISEVRRIAAHAEIYGIPVAPHNPLGPVAMAAAVHASAAMPNFLILEYCRRSKLFFDVQREGVVIRKNLAEVPERPGLGIELDESVIARHPYAPMGARLWLRPDGSVPGI